MTLIEFISKLEEIMALPKGSLRPEQKLVDIAEWDSIAVLSFIAFVDESLAITLNASSVQKAEKISDLIDLIRSKIEA